MSLNLLIRETSLNFPSSKKLLIHFQFQKIQGQIKLEFSGIPCKN